MITLAELEQRATAAFAAYLEADTFEARGAWILALKRLKVRQKRMEREEARRREVYRKRFMENHRRWSREWRARQKLVAA